MKSITIYMLIYSIVLILTLISEKIYNKSHKLSYFMSLICVTILCLFAAFRSYSVGTDIRVYGLNIFNICDNLGSISNVFSYYHSERAYYLLNFIIVKCFGNFKVLLFVLELFSSGIFYIVSYKVIKKNRTLFIFAFLLLWYNTTFNILRQSIAIGIIIYGYPFIRDKKYFKYIICVLISCLFHMSAIIALLAIVVRIIANKRNSFIYLIASCIGLLVIFYLMSHGIITLPAFSSKFNYYITSHAVISYPFLTFKILMFFVFYLFVNKNKDQELKFFLMMMILDIFFFSTSAFIRYGYRMSYYFLPFYPYFISKIYSILDEKKAKGKGTFVFLTIITLIFYWIIRYVVIKYDGVIPFEFYWDK